MTHIFFKGASGYIRINFYSLFIHLMCLFKTIDSYYYYLSGILSGLGDKAMIKIEKPSAFMKPTLNDVKYTVNNK